jgi:hypothetical protein
MDKETTMLRLTHNGFVMRLFILIGASLQTLLAQSDANVSLRYNRFYNYDEVVTLLKNLEKKHGKFLRLDSAGKSVENREMWIMTINNPATGMEMEKPAYSRQRSAGNRGYSVYNRLPDDQLWQG